MELITKDTLSTIKALDDGSAVLKLYNNAACVFEKTYKSFRGAKQAEKFYISHGAPGNNKIVCKWCGWTGTRGELDFDEHDAPSFCPVCGKNEFKKSDKKGYDIKKLFDVVDNAINTDRAVFHEPRDNSKLKGIPSFNLAPGRTCSAAACAHCLKEGCYAVKNACCHGYDIENNYCLKAWTENTALAINHPRELEKALDAWLTKNRPALFRIHSSGDMFSVEYARMWRRIAMRHAETRFLAFTKQFDVVRHVHFYKLANFELVLSGWTGVRVPDDLRKHYRVAWCNDGQEKRIPADAIHCPGDCNKCRACWYLSRLQKDSYFDKH